MQERRRCDQHHLWPGPRLPVHHHPDPHLGLGGVHFLHPLRHVRPSYTYLENTAFVVVMCGVTCGGIMAALLCFAFIAAITLNLCLTSVFFFSFYDLTCSTYLSPLVSCPHASINHTTTTQLRRGSGSAWHAFHPRYWPHRGRLRPGVRQCRRDRRNERHGRRGNSTCI